MITKDQIEKIITSKIETEGLFLVDITISSANHISVFIDGDKGVTIDQCAELSRFIEQSLNRDEEDFELDVSSAGLDLPLKVQKQYIKNIGRLVDIVLIKGNKISGVLKNANNTGVDIEVEKSVLIEGKKRKQLVTVTESYSYTDIKSTKIVVSFR
jgi:ribosome maturation factor RimP